MKTFYKPSSKPDDRSAKTYASAVGVARVPTGPAPVVDHFPRLGAPASAPASVPAPTPFVPAMQAREDFRDALHKIRENPSDMSALECVPSTPTRAQLDAMTPLERVTYCGDFLKEIEDQTPELCIAACRSNSHALYHVKVQTPEICLAAFEGLAKEWRKCVYDCAGSLLRHVKDQTPEVCMAAMKIDLRAFRSIRDPTPEQCLYAVSQCGLMLNYMKYKYRTREVCLAAFKQNRGAVKYVPDKRLAAQLEASLAYWYRNLVARNPRIQQCCCRGCCSFMMHMRIHQ